MSDTRVDKLAEHMTGSTEEARRALATSRIETMEAAGLLVIDANDPSLFDRLHRHPDIAALPTGVAVAEVIGAVIQALSELQATE